MLGFDDRIAMIAGPIVRSFYSSIEIQISSFWRRLERHIECVVVELGGGSKFESIVVRQK
jgi:hypothetical protein